MTAIASFPSAPSIKTLAKGITIADGLAELDINVSDASYQDLRLVFEFRVASTGLVILMGFNGVLSGVAYDWTNSDLLAATIGIGFQGQAGAAMQSNAQANNTRGVDIYNILTLDVPNYASSSHFKNCFWRVDQSTLDTAGQQRLNLGQGRWKSNSPITQINLKPTGSDVFKDFGIYSLYLIGK
jgi:hypothetical protein